MIEQFIISAGIQFFKHVMESYGLQCVNEGGYDPEASCLFYGNYFKEDAERIKAHRGPAMLVWGGSDAIHPSSLEGIRICTDLKHIAISNWLYDKLTRYGFDPKFVPLRTCDATKWKPEPLGNKVYCYCPNETYNRSMVERIAYKSKYEFIIITDHKQST